MIKTAADVRNILASSPSVDGDVMLWIAREYDEREVTQPECGMSATGSDDLPSAPLPDVPFSARFMLSHEPVIDDGTFTHRIRTEAEEDDGIGPWPVGFSVVWHCVILALVIGFANLSESTYRLDDLSNQAIEVAFGIAGDTSRALPDGKIADEKAEAEALKTIEQLPQLPKTLTIDAATPVPDERDLAEAPTLSKSPMPTTAPTVTAAPTVAATAKALPVVDQTPIAGAKKLKIEELAKRLEKEQRAVGQKERAGTDKKTRNDVFKRPSDIPINPLGRDIPKPPSTLLQSGSLQGKVGLQVKNEYAQAAATHMRKHWTLPDVMSFESKLEVVVGFDINSFGRILGRVRIIKASGNSRFDEEAIKAIESAGPFPDLPREMGQKLSLKMKFSPNSINF